MATQLRWGIIGAGGIAGKFASELALSDTGSVVAIGSRRQETADAFGDKFGVPNRHASYRALVHDPEVDIVYVATPHPMHFADTKLALEAGKHVLVEKAFTMTAAEARELVALARQKNLFLMEAMKTRFLPHIAAVRDIIASGELGEIVMVTADHGQWFAEDPEHRLFKPELGGGALLDLGVYVVSFASSILGPPSSVKALITPAFTGVDGTTSILLGHDSGAHAVLTCTSLARSGVVATIVGTDGRIEIDRTFYAPTSFTVTPREGEVRRWEQPHEGSGLRHEADEAARCIADGLIESPFMPLDETITIMETMEAVLAQA